MQDKCINQTENVRIFSPRIHLIETRQQYQIRIHALCFFIKLKLTHTAIRTHTHTRHLCDQIEPTVGTMSSQNDGNQKKLHAQIISCCPLQNRTRNRSPDSHPQIDKHKSLTQNGNQERERKKQLCCIYVVRNNLFIDFELDRTKYHSSDRWIYFFKVHIFHFISLFFFALSLVEMKCTKLTAANINELFNTN